jgi:type IV pilus assembly protein PilO
MTKSRQWVIGAAVLALLVLVAGWFLLVSPKRSKAAELKTETASQQSANQTLQMQIAQLKARVKDLPKEQALLAEIAGKLPSDPALPSLIRDLSKAADDADVTLVSLTPGQPALMQAAPIAQPAAKPATAAGGATSGTPAAPAANVGQLAMIPLTISVTGGFFQVEQFISNLESLNRALMTTGLEAAPGGAPSSSQASGSTSGPNTLAVSLTSRVFMTVLPAAAAAPAAPVQSGTK